MTPEDDTSSTPPDWDEWVDQELAGAEKRALRGHALAKWSKRLGVVAAAVVLAGGSAVTYFFVTHSAAAELRKRVASGAAAADAARPVINGQKAFPDATVRLANGAVYRRVDSTTASDCGHGVSRELAAVIKQGKGCLRLSAALYTDADRHSQVTVSVLSFVRAEDAAMVFGSASTDPVTFSVVPLDPSAGSGLPKVHNDAVGVFNRLMTARTVVFSNAQWSTGKATDGAVLTKEDTDLLTYVDAKVTAFEEANH
ncbi:MAG: hypothetical protein QOI83_4514 [Streptomycetaceae bacterium]|nr:hypothetical protein [Streptomycetaceae bacterium]